MSASVSFSVAFGVVPGYWHGNTAYADALRPVAAVWQDVCDAEYRNTGAVVGGVVSPALVAYPRYFGCPDGGEIAAVVTGASNPAFTPADSLNGFKLAVERVADSVRQKLNQTTALLSFSDGTAVYLRAEQSA